MRSERDERGSAAVEAVIGVPAFALFVGLIIFGGRTAIDSRAVESAAADAARTASIAAHQRQEAAPAPRRQREPAWRTKTSTASPSGRRRRHSRLRAARRPGRVRRGHRLRAVSTSQISPCPASQAVAT